VFVWSYLQLLNVITAFTDSLSSTGLSVHLYTNNVTPTRNDTLTTYTEADYTGYAAVNLTGQNAAVWQSQGSAVQYTTTQAAFSPTGTTVGNVIYGYYVSMATSPATLLGAELLPSPVSLGSPADQLIIITALGISDGQVPGITF
jgi:hypothetical protein